MAIPTVIRSAAVCPENTNQQNTGWPHQGRFVHCRMSRRRRFLKVFPRAMTVGDLQEGIEVRHWQSLLAYWSITFFHFEPGKFGAGGGNRTRVASLEDWNSTIELRPQRISSYWRLLPCQFTCVYLLPQ